ncbi:MAG TPA: hypothetical protein VJ783_32365 [Pirellulales bacterium]|nr:hypothetical protein [Pirellulales bacterium]
MDYSGNKWHVEIRFSLLSDKYSYLRNDIAKQIEVRGMRQRQDGTWLSTDAIPRKQATSIVRNIMDLVDRCTTRDIHFMSINLHRADEHPAGPPKARTHL